MLKKNMIPVILLVGFVFTLCTHVIDVKQTQEKDNGISVSTASHSPPVVNNNFSYDYFQVQSDNIAILAAKNAMVEVSQIQATLWFHNYLNYSNTAELAQVNQNRTVPDIVGETLNLNENLSLNSAYQSGEKKYMFPQLHC